MQAARRGEMKAARRGATNEMIERAPHARCHAIARRAVSYVLAVLNVLKTATKARVREKKAEKKETEIHFSFRSLTYNS